MNIENENTNKGEKINKKRGRKKKTEIREKQNYKDQNKFIVDVTNEKESKENIIKVLEQVNDKSFGREINVKEILLILLPKLTSKEVERLQENSLSDKEKIQQAHIEYNQKNNSNLTFDEFLIKRLGIS
jgi:hypothetical protein